VRRGSAAAAAAPRCARREGGQPSSKGRAVRQQSSDGTPAACAALPSPRLAAASFERRKKCGTPPVCERSRSTLSGLQLFLPALAREEESARQRRSRASCMLACSGCMHAAPAGSQAWRCDAARVMPQGASRERQRHGQGARGCTRWKAQLVVAADKQLVQHRPLRSLHPALTPTAQGTRAPGRLLEVQANERAARGAASSPQMQPLRREGGRRSAWPTIAAAPRALCGVSGESDECALFSRSHRGHRSASGARQHVRGAGIERRVTSGTLASREGAS
jgi:hypothetical protein